MPNVRLITTGDELEALAPAWRALWQSQPDATPFDSPAWLLSWWKCLGHGELWTLALENEAGQLIGLAPLFRYTDPANGWRRLLFLGTSVSDELNVLTAPGQHEPVLEALGHFLEDHSDEWDVVDLQELRAQSVVRMFLPAGLVVRGTPCAVRPVVPLPETAEQYRASLGSGLRRNLRRYREQLAALGPITFETATPATHAEFAAAFFTLHKSRWQERIESMMDQPRVERFHCEAMAALAEAGLLRLHGLRLNGEIVAIVYALQAGLRAYSYLGGFRPELSGYTPGTLIMGYAIEQAIAEGAREWDFLRGAEKYKYAWGALDQSNYRVRWRHPGSPSAALDDE